MKWQFTENLNTQFNRGLKASGRANLKELKQSDYWPMKELNTLLRQTARRIPISQTNRLGILEPEVWVRSHS